LAKKHFDNGDLALLSVCPQNRHKKLELLFIGKNACHWNIIILYIISISDTIKGAQQGRKLRAWSPSLSQVKLKKKDKILDSL